MARFIVACALAFALGVLVRCGINAAKVQQKYREGFTAGVETMRHEAVRHAHATYHDVDNDGRSDFVWNTSRSMHTGTIEKGATPTEAFIEALQP